MDNQYRYGGYLAIGIALISAVDHGYSLAAVTVAFVIYKFLAWSWKLRVYNRARFIDDVQQRRRQF
jgi:hypothetical protein